MARKAPPAPGALQPVSRDGQNSFCPWVSTACKNVYGVLLLLLLGSDRYAGLGNHYL